MCSQSSSDVESDINVTESESEISTSSHGNNFLQSTEDNSSIASESLPPDDNNTEHSDLSDDGSNDFDLSDIVDTDNIMQNDGEGSVMTEILNKPIMWTSTFRKVYTKPFIHPSGPNLPAEFDVANATAMKYFSLFFTDDVFQKICTNTNLYHQHQVTIKCQMDPNYIDKNWVDIEINQLKCYFGMSIIMGLNKLGWYKQYWVQIHSLAMKG